MNPIVCVGMHTLSAESDDPEPRTQNHEKQYRQRYFFNLQTEPINFEFKVNSRFYKMRPVFHSASLQPTEQLMWYLQRGLHA